MQWTTLSVLSVEARTSVLAAMSIHSRVTLLVAMPGEMRGIVFVSMSTSDRASVVGMMPIMMQAALLRMLSADARGAVLAAMSADVRAALEAALLPISIGPMSVDDMLGLRGQIYSISGVLHDSQNLAIKIGGANIRFYDLAHRLIVSATSDSSGKIGRAHV